VPAHRSPIAPSHNDVKRERAPHEQTTTTTTSTVDTVKCEHPPPRRSATRGEQPTSAQRKGRVDVSEDRGATTRNLKQKRVGTWGRRAMRPQVAPKA
jgi:hypothetical protein